jgi:hypothetical protein
MHEKTDSGCLLPKRSSAITTDMKWISFAALCAALVILGCGHSNAIVGKWKADAADGKLKGAESVFSFEFKKDNTFIGPFSMEGTYTVSGYTVELTTTKLMGMDAIKRGSSAEHKFLKAELSADGKTLTIHPDKPGTASTASSDLKLIRDTGQ